MSSFRGLTVAEVSGGEAAVQAEIAAYNERREWPPRACLSGPTAAARQAAYRPAARARPRRPAPRPALAGLLAGQTRKGPRRESHADTRPATRRARRAALACLRRRDVDLRESAGVREGRAAGYSAGPQGRASRQTHSRGRSRRWPLHGCPHGRRAAARRAAAASSRRRGGRPRPPHRDARPAHRRRWQTDSGLAGGPDRRLRAGAGARDGQA